MCARRCKGRGDARIDELSGYVCMCMYGRMDGWMDVLGVRKGQWKRGAFQYRPVPPLLFFSFRVPLYLSCFDLLDCLDSELDQSCRACVRGNHTVYSPSPLEPLQSPLYSS